MSDLLRRSSDFAIDSARVRTIGKTISNPVLIRSDGTNATYAVDVQVLGHLEALRGVTIADAGGEVHYAELGSGSTPGAAVELERDPLTGAFKIIGFGKAIPGNLNRYLVGGIGGDVGAPAGYGYTSHRFTFGELKDYGGGWGRIPWGAYGIWHGATLEEIRA